VESEQPVVLVDGEEKARRVEPGFLFRGLDVLNRQQPLFRVPVEGALVDRDHRLLVLAGHEGADPAGPAHRRKVVLGAEVQLQQLTDPRQVPGRRDARCAGVVAV
jgi:hypothetical protein